MNNNIAQAEFDDIFKKISVNIYAHLKGSKSKGSNYDPNRNIGYIVNKNNPIPIKALYRPVTPSSLTYQQIGLVESGAVEILIRNNDIGLVKLSEKIVIKNKKYSAFSEAVGNRVQIFESQFSGYSKIILFLRIA